MEPKLYRYVDPRTGEDEYASPDDIEAVKRYLMAWKFYWDGPMRAIVDDEGETIYVPRYEREMWLFDIDERQDWLDSLSKEQRVSLEASYPPEEVPHLESSS